MEGSAVWGWSVDVGLEHMHASGVTVWAAIIGILRKMMLGVYSAVVHL